jgi:hypothetical protein
MSTIARRRREWHERLLLATGGQTVFACLAAVATGTPPAIETTVAFGLLLAGGLELQARRTDPRRRAIRTSDPR